MKITIIGTGYVGLVTGVSMAALGHSVICVGRDEEKIKEINRAKSPFFEPGLDALLKKVIVKKFLSATTDLEKSVIHSDITILAVGTPTVSNKIDLSAIEKATQQIGIALKKSKKYHVISVKSTVVPGTTENTVKPILEKFSGKMIGTFGLCMTPEFLREGQAVEDALYPDRIVVGGYDKKSAESFLKIYKKVNTPKLITDLKTAEMIKYASNALFATLISYSNEIGRICETVGGIDAVDVWKGVHLDKRITPKVGKKRITPGIASFILSGCGYGGSCFPKDTKALANFAASLDMNDSLIKSVIEINATQPSRMIALLKNALKKINGRKIAVLGLAFKPNTDDLRESPAIPIIKELIQEKAKVIVHDPVVYKEGIKPELEQFHVTFAKTIQDAITGADALVIVTAWDDYKKLTPLLVKKYMNKLVIIDGRRILSKENFIKAGFIYKGIGFSE